ncbi:RHS repeat-associated core domain-containing protein [Pseudomonas monteilii]|uniref:RHS repeat-associated core domain-containing protein n=1 Tax=Pseudomonas monteilii TaxID=76759 RepID=UPI001F1B57A4|nr:RHS repeat-associated core domain-containing protein [Pseudomonas monteilii]
MKIFYQKSRPITFAANDAAQSILEYASQIFAYLCTDEGPDNVSITSVDGHNSPISLNVASRATHFKFSPYGYAPNLGMLPLGFNGERHDHIGGLYLLGNGYRGYSPALMRFNSPDSLSPFAEGGVSSYTYTGNDPINRVDPTGHYYGRAQMIEAPLIVYYKRNFLGQKKRLIILSHGKPGFIQAGENTLNAAQLTRLLNNNNIKTNKLPAEMHFCFSATNTKNGESFTQDYANINKVGTSGFDGKIETRDSLFSALPGDSGITIRHKLPKPNPHHNDPNKRYPTHELITASPQQQMPLIRV